MKSHGIRGVLICFLLVSPSLAEPPIPVVCPAVEQASDYPELVLVVREYKQEDNVGEYEVVRVLYGSYGKQTIRISPYLPMDYVGDKRWPKVEGDFIIALTPPEYWRKSNYKACYRLPISEERAEAALCRARLDYAALASTCIFVGERAGFSSVEDYTGDLSVLDGQRVERINADDGKPNGVRVVSRIVDVVRVIHGDSLWPKQRITTNEDVPSDYKKLQVDSESQIYFVSPIERNQLNTIFKVYTHRPIDQESEVREALGRLERYAVVEESDLGTSMMSGMGGMGRTRDRRAGLDSWKDKTEDGDEEQAPCDYFPEGMESLPKIYNGPPAKCREIIFLGPDAEAIELLGTTSDGAATLFYRTLFHRRQTTRSKVVAAIEKEMFRVVPSDGARKDSEYLRLHRLINLLGDMREKDGGGDVERLVEAYLTHIERDAPAPQTNNKWSDWEEVELLDETNHSLTWLINQLDRRECCAKFGNRLSALRSKATGQWRKEIQTAADAINLQEYMVLNAAMSAMKNAKPVRSSSGLRHVKNGWLDAVAFSHDGKLLATAGDGGIIQIWNTADWSCAVAIEQGRTKRLIFSPDGKYLYAAGGGKYEVFARFDTRSGKLDKAYQGKFTNVSAMEISPDGRTMATMAYGDINSNYRALNFWDTDSGEILRNIRVLRHESCLYPSPDGRGIVRPVGKDKTKRWIFEPFRGKGGKTVAFPKNVWPGHITPSVSDFVYGSYRDTETIFPDVILERAGYILWGRWTKEGLNIRTRKKTEIQEIRDPAVSPNGKLLAVVGRRGVVQLFSLPEMNILGKISSNNCYVTNNEKPFAFSPDGKILAVAAIAPSPILIRTDTLEQLTPYEGHLTRYPDVYFDADGKRLRTIGEDNLVCTWDLATMKMIGRVNIPAEFQYWGTRDSDGRYLICSKGNRKTTDKDDGPLCIIDSDTGKIIAETDVPNGWFFWINDHEALCLDFSTEVEADIYRFDYRNGKVLNTWKSFGEEGDCHLLYSEYLWHWTKDGRLYCFIYEFDNPFEEDVVLRTAVFDPKTGRFEHNPNRIVSSDFSVATYDTGLVPGEKYFYLIDPGVSIYDRSTLQLVWKNPLLETFIGQFAFSDDGKLLAVVTADINSFVGKDIIHIYDVESGKLLWAFAPKDYCNGQIKFSHDGRRLAMVNEDGTISIWTLSEKK